MLSACITAPPVQEMSDARQAIAAAEQARAGELASDELAIAKRLLGQAEQHIRAHEYTAARRDAMASHTRAVQARRMAEAKQAEQQR